VLFDSTILIDFLNNVDGAREAISDSNQPAISVITWIEVLAGARTVHAERSARDLLSAFQVFQVTGRVATAAVTARRERRLKLPDAIIWATARIHGLTLVTRNTRDFPADDPWILVPYRI